MSEKLAHEGIEAESRPWYPPAYRLKAPLDVRQYLYKAGLVHIQEEVSMIPPFLLDPLPGDRVLDLCAAPGNKTAQIAVLMENKGTLVANDRNRHRSRAIKGILDRLGIYNTTTTTCNAANFPAQSGSFDRILADVPCTCEGTVRKNPNVAFKSGIDQSIQKSGLQKAILRKAFQRCRPGGRIVYATCTFAPEENECVVDSTLKEYGEDSFRVVSAMIPHLITSPGLTCWSGQPYHASMRNAVRIWPHQNDTGGFFVAVIEKSASCSEPKEKKLGNSEEEGPKQLPTVDRLHWLGFLKDRFGIPPKVFENVQFVQKSRQYVSVVSRTFQPLAQPAPDTTGMAFIQTKWKYPKLTAASAMTFGDHALRNYIVVDRAQMNAFYERNDFEVTVEQARYCTGTGFVLLRFEKNTLGIGLFHRETDGGIVRSMFPKAWMNPEVHD